jgi:hypothetical protein
MSPSQGWLQQFEYNYALINFGFGTLINVNINCPMNPAAAPASTAWPQHHTLKPIPCSRGVTAGRGSSVQLIVIHQLDHDQLSPTES